MVLRRCVLYLAFLALASCGGGGGGGAGGGLGPPLGPGYLRSTGGSNWDRSTGCATWADGSCVVTGYFSGTTTWGAGEPTETTLTSAGPGDVSIARYNADGSLAWVKQAGGVMQSYGWAVATIPDGSCIVTGSFEDQVVFGAGESNATLLDDVDDQGDIFVARYNADGTLAWAKRAGRNDRDEGLAVSTHADGSCVVTGSFRTIAVFGPGEAHATTLTTFGSGVFVAAYHPDGTLAWARSAGGGGQAEGQGIEILSDGSSIVCGYYGTGAAVFGAGEPNQTTLAWGGDLDSFAARYNVDGSLAWARRVTGPSFVEAYSISAFPDEGFLLGGFCRTGTTFGPGEPNQTVVTTFADTNDAFLARYAPDGSLLWVRTDGGSGQGDTIQGVGALADGTCLLAGTFDGLAAFGLGSPGQTVRAAVGGIDMFAAHYTADGTPLWVRTGGTTDDDYAWGMAPFPEGSMIAVGEYFGVAVFNPGLPDESALPSSGVGGMDAFLARYTPGGGLE